uniref:Uncharacterized protein n=1 Tax=Rhizophora mucronata TaxID=61149 RepID=A0A2P2N4S6_RHIMU
MVHAFMVFLSIEYLLERVVFTMILFLYLLTV